MKIALLLFAFCFLANAGFSAEPFTHAATGVTLPDTLGGISRGEVLSYESSPAEKGNAIFYRGKDLEITVFIKSMDPEKLLSPALIVEESLAAIKVLEKSGIYSNVKVHQAKDDAKGRAWAKSALTAEKNGRPMISLIYGTVRENHSIKLRITSDNPGDPSIEKFVEEFQKAVDAAKPVK